MIPDGSFAFEETNKKETNKNEETHQENMSMKSIPPKTPLLCRKTGVCRGTFICLIFETKHRLRVLVRTASTGEARDGIFLTTKAGASNLILTLLEKLMSFAHMQRRRDHSNV